MASLTASITVFPDHRLNKIDRKIYSGFTEHMGRCIMGGLYDPTNPNADLLSPENFRTDVISALKSLEIPVFRYPGGNFCATYHWLDGVGPRESRPARPELAWESVETNQFGTDEFMQWCKHVNAEPYLCLNFGTGTLDEALGWVEYCNGTKNTYYANLRRKNGHEEPYRVKYWALGNEMWGPWQMCQMTQEAYADKAYQWAKALKLLDPSIELILCGKEGATSWDYHTLRTCLVPAGMSDLGHERGPLIDMHSIHMYTASEKNHYENAFAPLAAERAIEVCSSLIDLAMIENKIPPHQKRPTICFDEWNVWSPTRAPGPKGAEEKYTLSDALAVAVWLNVFLRKSKDLGMACIAQSVNVISPLMTTEKGIVKQTTWFPYEVFCKFMRGTQIAVHLDFDQDGEEDGREYTGTTKPEYIRALKKTEWLDVSACIDDETNNNDNDVSNSTEQKNKYINLSVVNIHEKKDIEVSLNLSFPNNDPFTADKTNIVDAGTTTTTTTINQEENTMNTIKVQVYTVTGENVNVTNMDNNNEEKVNIQISEWDYHHHHHQHRGVEEREGGENKKFIFPKHSFTLLRWKI